jgi:hypothetical protein
LFVNISFAFDPYADEEQETRSKSKLYWGIFMTLVGGFLAYDGFSQEEIDISRPSVDYGGCINAYWSQHDHDYSLFSGCGRSGSGDDGSLDNEPNKIYNNGNVDLTDVVIKVRYLYANGNFIDDVDLYHEGNPNPLVLDDDGYFVASGTLAEGSDTLEINKSATWSDKTTYSTSNENAPYGKTNVTYFQEGALRNLIDVKVEYKYKHKYKKQNKSDIEGVAGLMVATAGIYFIVDYFMDLHKFNQYMKRNDINIRLANAPNEYKLLFQKRL